MRQAQFLNLLEGHMWRNFNVKDPHKMANIIYFIIKQYPEMINKKRNYVALLKTVKMTLSTSNYGWSISKIHKCFVELYKLLKYAKKST